VPPDQALGLYVHVPFCEAKCSYCHFAIDPRRPDEARRERYLRAVLAEIGAGGAADGAADGAAAHGTAAEGTAADTLYFGGGTPSLLPVARLGVLVSNEVFAVFV